MLNKYAFLQVGWHGLNRSQENVRVVCGDSVSVRFSLCITFSRAVARSMHSAIREDGRGKRAETDCGRVVYSEISRQKISNEISIARSIRMNLWTLLSIGLRHRWTGANGDERTPTASASQFSFIYFPRSTHISFPNNSATLFSFALIGPFQYYINSVSPVNRFIRSLFTFSVLSKIHLLAHAIDRSRCQGHSLRSWPRNRFAGRSRVP